MQELQPRSDLSQIAKFLDAKFRGPFGSSFGWDGILGLFPGVGDLISSSLSFYIIFRASILGCPPSVLMRMGVNSGIESFLNLVPGLGILADFVWKANVRNVRLVDAYLEDPRRTQVRSRVAVGLILIFTAAIFVVLLYCSFLAIHWLLGLRNGRAGVSSEFV